MNRLDVLRTTQRSSDDCTVTVQLLRLLQAALDRALALDPQADVILQALNGKRIDVHIEGAMPVELVVEFSHARILLGQRVARSSDDSPASHPAEPDFAHPSADEADVTISGSASALATLARGGTELPSTMRVKVQGDIALLQQARATVARLRPDFDEPLARLIGDELAYPVSGALRKLIATVGRTARELGDDAKEFLSDESGLLAANDTVQQFGDEVDRLRDALARLDKRVLRVASRLGPPTQ
jgi:ubiquinone biosynthesis protein UbiJ